MKKIESLFITGALVGMVVVTGSIVLRSKIFDFNNESVVQSTKYGAFLAAQHATFVNDFDAAKQFSSTLDDYASVVQNIKTLSVFLSGDMPENVADLKKESGTLYNLKRVLAEVSPKVFIKIKLPSSL